MRIQFWHSSQVDEWRWSLYTKKYAPDGKQCHQETGTSTDIRKAFDDVANTVEFLVDTKYNET